MQCHLQNTNSWRQRSGFKLYVCVTNACKAENPKKPSVSREAEAGQERIPTTGHCSHSCVLFGFGFGFGFGKGREGNKESKNSWLLKSIDFAWTV